MVPKNKIKVRFMTFTMKNILCQLKQYSGNTYHSAEFLFGELIYPQNEQ